MEQENTMLLFYEKKKHFADLINGWIFGGEARISPESLGKEDRRSVRRSRPGGKIHNRYRDIVHRVEQTRIRVVIDTEFQSYIDYLAPVRSMDYDTASYYEQIRALESRHQAAKDLREDEFLSGIGKNDRLIPTITLILYFGQHEWDAAENLHELLFWEQIPEEMRAYIGNYPTHVLDVYHTPDERLLEFPGDMGYMFLYLKYQEDKKALKRMIEELPAFRHLDRDVYETLAEYTNTPELLKINEKKRRRRLRYAKWISRIDRG
ncbi:MAG: Rpn family recombination-promoting nuclease/putative transposase [Lachnospiraceae bacterium]|nr:Rpn family recombination-promoting nuclease/putative transposase [Lachnospiraceae bacterium]